MLEFLTKLFKRSTPKACKYEEPKLTPQEEIVKNFLRAHRPCHTSELHKVINKTSVPSVIKRLRQKGYVIDCKYGGKNTTYLIRNRKCH